MRELVTALDVPYDQLPRVTDLIVTWEETWQDNIARLGTGKTYKRRDWVQERLRKRYLRTNKNPLSYEYRNDNYIRGGVPIRPFGCRQVNSSTFKLVY